MDSRLPRRPATGASVAVLLDTPWPKLDAVDCAAAHPLHLSRCTQRAPQAIRDPARRTALRRAARAGGVTVIDPAQGVLLCSAQTILLSCV
ncbi:hypothetical protein [Streptomyces sp. NPDC102462]|uniref:hypothetical protein n=1 Tax=Streptomyces sp. NPDC102462 TaxID=3366178 RepID=UPI00382C5032